MKRLSEWTESSTKRQFLESAVYDFRWPDTVLDTMFDFQLVQFSSLCKRFRDRAAKLITDRLFSRLLHICSTSDFNPYPTRLCGIASLLIDRGSITKEAIQLKVVPLLRPGNWIFEGTMLSYPLLAGDRLEASFPLGGSLWSVYNARDRGRMRISSWGALGNSVLSALSEGMPSDAILDAIQNSIELGPDILDDRTFEQRCLRMIEMLIFGLVPVEIISALAIIGRVWGKKATRDRRHLPTPQQFPPRSYLLSIQESGAVDLFRMIENRLSDDTPFWDDNLQSLVDQPIVYPKKRIDFGVMACIALRRLHPSLYNNHPWLTPEMLVDCFPRLTFVEIRRHGFWILDRINPTPDELYRIIPLILDTRDPVPLLKICSKLTAFPDSIEMMIQSADTDRLYVFVLLDVLAELGIKSPSLSLDVVDAESYDNWRRRATSMRTLIDAVVKGVVDQKPVEL